MAHCILLEKGTDNIIHYIENCVKTGRDFIGSNAEIRGAKESAYDEKWIDTPLTLDTEKSTEIQKVFVEKVAEIQESVKFKGQGISSPLEVDFIVEIEVRKLYSLEKEVAILRRRLLGDKTYEPDYETKLQAIFEEAEVQKAKFRKEQ